MSKKISWTAPFECHGVELGDASNDNKVGDCPFCDKTEHFFVNPTNGLWDCKHCGLRGNVITFLTMLAKEYRNSTSLKDFARLAKARGIPSQAFIDADVGWNNRMWMIPAYSETGTVRDIRRWDGKKIMATHGCKLQLWGLRELAKADRGSRIWIMEGEWDAIAWRWLLKTILVKDIVVGVPGARTWKPDLWNKWFAGMNVTICFDNDGPGDDGSMSIGKHLAPFADSVSYLNWPDSRPYGWDINDAVREGLTHGLSNELIFSRLEKLISPKHRRDTSSPGKAAPTQLGSPSSGNDQPPASFKEVLTKFNEWLEMDQDMVDCLAVSLAVCMSNDVKGDPLWVYLIGPPGSGKTAILMSTKESHRVFFRSTLTPGSLVSGFNVNPDPSLLPQLNGRTAVFKDATELLALHPTEREKIYGILRGAFDGQVNKSFGNGVVRNYDNLHFSLLMGVTPAVHGDNQASMGERFLKYEMVEDQKKTQSKITMALDNIGEESQMEVELASVVKSFLTREVGPLPPLPDWFRTRIVALSQLLSMLRAKVDREATGDRDIRYKPSHEIGTRVAKQLAKLGMMLAEVFQTEIDSEVARIVERVAFHTMIDFHVDIVRAIALNGYRGATRPELAKTTRIPIATLGRRLEDLELLNILEMEKIKDDTRRTTNLYRIAPTVLELWTRAKQPVNPTWNNGKVGKEKKS